jgi:hypothetical protein
MTNIPDVLPLSGTFYVDISYSTSNGQEDQITIDILSTDANPTWYGKGAVNVTGSGRKTITVKIFAAGGLTDGKQYILRAWTVQSSRASDSSPWSYELDREDALVYAGETPSQTITTGSVKESTASSLVYSVMVLACSLLVLLL